MPLIIITGLPCSGKTHRASQIVTEFNARILSGENARRTVVHLPSGHAQLDADLAASLECSKESELGKIPDNTSSLREQNYTTAGAEKNARAAEFSAVKRAIGRDAVAIADGLNYIKGYRYQLWCEAKAAGTRCCVVHVAAREDEVKAWNRARLVAWGKDEAIYEDGLGDSGHDVKKQGQADVRGDLLPESHTAVYGDRVVEPTSMSRSSSMDGLDDGDGRDAEADGMTLKSLSLHDNARTQLNGTTTRSSTTPLPSLPQTSNLSPSTTARNPPQPSSAPPYTPSTLASLLMRYEPPSPFARWDTPLFTVPTSDSDPPYQAIWDAIFPPPVSHLSKKALSQLPRTAAEEAEAPRGRDVKQHAATILPQATASNALQVLESATGEVVTALLASARRLGLAEGEGGAVPFTVSDAAEEIEVELTIPPGVVLTQPLLQRLRRKYTQIQRGGIAHGVGYYGGGRKGAAEGFVRFLEGEWGE